MILEFQGFCLRPLFFIFCEGGKKSLRIEEEDSKKLLHVFATFFNESSIERMNDWW